MGYVIPLNAFAAPCEEDDNDPESDLDAAEGVSKVFEDSGGDETLTDEGLVNNRPTDMPDYLGCPKVCVAGPYKPDSNNPWIVLVQQGGCQFVEKAREAQRLGAKAIVIYRRRQSGNLRESRYFGQYVQSWYVCSNPSGGLLWMADLLDQFSEDALDVKIATTFIRNSEYIELYSFIRTSNTSHNGLRTLSLLLSTESSAWEWYP